MTLEQYNFGRPTAPLKVRLLEHFGMSVNTYAPEYVYEAGYYVEPDFSRRRKQEFAARITAAAIAGEIPDALGLEYAESELFTDRFWQSHIVYHGSPHKLQQIEPRQAIWNDKDPNKPHRFGDGQPAICASPTTKFPAMRALLHSAHPELAGQTLHLQKVVDLRGSSSWVTSEETLATLEAEGTTGYVYPIELQPAGTRDRCPPEMLSARGEYRIHGSRRRLMYVPVGATALPPDLCVILADAQAQLNTVHRNASILQWGERNGVDVRPLGGLWPTEYVDY